MDYYTDLHWAMAQLLICHGIMEESRLVTFFQSHTQVPEGSGPSFYFGCLSSRLTCKLV